MNILQSIDKKIKSLFSTKKNLILLCFVCLIALCLILFKNYSSGDFFEKDYRIGIDSRWLHTGLQGKERNFSAFSGDVFARIGQLQDLQFHLVNDTIENLERDLQAKKIDGLLTKQRPNPISLNSFVFSDLFYATGPVLIIPLKSNFIEWNQNPHKIIGTEAKSNLIGEIEKDPSTHIRRYDDILEALADLKEGRIDGAIFPTIPAHVYVSTFYSTELKIASLPLTTDGIRLMALKNSDGLFLIEEFNQGLKKLKEEKFYQKLLKRWGLVHGDQPLEMEVNTAS